MWYLLAILDWMTGYILTVIFKDPVESEKLNK